MNFRDAGVSIGTGSDLKVEGGLVCAVDKVAAHEEGVAWLTHVGKVGIGDGQLCGGGDGGLISCHHQLLALLHFQHPRVMRPALRMSFELGSQLCGILLDH